MGWKPTSGEFINVVRDHSATGDGTTDDSAAIQAAIDAAEARVAAAPATGSVTVYFPGPATYIANALTVEQSGIRLLLDPNATLKQKAGTYNIGSDSVGIVTVAGTVGSRISRVVIEGGTFDGNKANVTNTGNQDNLECVEFRYTDDCHIVGSRLINGYSDGVDWDFAADCSAVRVWAEDCGGWGFHPSLDSTRIRMIDCDAVNCGDDRSRGGFDQWYGDANVATDCSFIRCRAVDCYQNFDIGSSGAHVGMLRSEGTTTVADNFSGVSLDLDDPVVSATTVRDAGRWEVVVSGTAPPVAVTNNAEDDWVYAWVED